MWLASAPTGPTTPTDSLASLNTHPRQLCSFQTDGAISHIKARHCTVRRDLPGAFNRLRSALRAKNKADSGKLEAAFDVYRQMLRLCDLQCQQAAALHAPFVMACKVDVVQEMHRLAVDHPGQVDADQRRAIESLKEDAIFEAQVVKQVRSEFDARLQKMALGSERVQAAAAAPLTTVSEYLILVAMPPVLVLLLVAGGTGALATLLLGRGDTGADDGSNVGPVGQLGSLAVAATIAVVLFGLMPAEIISPHVQAWTFTVLLLLLPSLIAVLLGWLWMLRRRFQFSLGSLLVATAALALLLGVLALAGASSDYLAGLPWDFTIPALPVGEFPIEYLAAEYRASGDFGKLASLQWIAWQGPYLTLVLWAILIAAVQAFRLWRRRQGGPVPAMRQRLAGLARSFRRDSLLLAAVLAIVSLPLAWRLVDISDAAYHWQMLPGRNPEAYWGELEAARDDVLGDEPLLQKFREAAKAEASAAPAPPHPAIGPGGPSLPSSGDDVNLGMSEGGQARQQTAQIVAAPRLAPP